MAACALACGGGLAAPRPPPQRHLRAQRAPVRPCRAPGAQRWAPRAGAAAEGAAERGAECTAEPAAAAAELELAAAPDGGAVPAASTPAAAAGAAPSGAAPAPDPEAAAAEAALRALAGAAAEIFRLAVLLPLRYLVLAPAAWALARLGFLAADPAEVLGRLDAAAAAGAPPAAAAVAAALRALNRRHPAAAAEWVEARGLLRAAPLGVGAAAAAAEPAAEPGVPAAAAAAAATATAASTALPVDAAVVREYLVALVRSGRLADFAGDAEAAAAALEGAAGAGAGAARRSLPLLLAELRAAAGGAPLPSAPGGAPAWPLHVVVSGGGGGAAAGSGLLATLKAWAAFASVLFALSLVWAVGAVAVRRQAGGASALGAPLGGAPPGAATPRELGGGAFAPKEYSREATPERSQRTFADVKGCDEAVAELQEIVSYLKSPDKFTRLGGKLPKGVLLTGAPGTGKTLLARAVAGEAGVPFFYKAGSEFDEMFVGVGSRRVRALFAAAKRRAPCIIFIDEVDAVGGKRSSYESSGGSRKTLNQLLTEIDGFEDNSGVVVIAATNLPELLDPALTRPGRFDRTVAVALPDARGRRAILDLNLKGKPLAPDVDADSLARRTPGFSGAQLANLVNEAALLAARGDAERVDAALLDEARDKVLMGSPRALSQTLEARTLTAYHEGGHALVALHTPGAKPIHKATIQPRGHALGMVTQLPDADEYSTTKRQMLAHVDVCMGGKAAEELIFGEDSVTSGATSDLRAATRLARHMVEECGMSAAVGPVAIAPGDGAAPGVRAAVDAEVAAMLKAAYARVAALLRAREGELHALAAALLERETLTQQEIRDVLGLGGAAPAGAPAAEAAAATAPVAAAAGK